MTEIAKEGGDKVCATQTEISALVSKFLERFIIVLHEETLADAIICPYRAGEWQPVKKKFDGPTPEDLHLLYWAFYQGIIEAHLYASQKASPESPLDIGAYFCQAFHQIATDVAIHDIFGTIHHEPQMRLRNKVLGIDDPPDMDHEIHSKASQVREKITQYHELHMKDRFHEMTRIAYHVIMKNYFGDSWKDNVGGDVLQKVTGNINLQRYTNNLIIRKLVGIPPETEKLVASREQLLEE